MKKIFDLNAYKETAAQMNAEGCVLLKNENAALPLTKGQPLCLLGRAQMNYYKTGTGSGSMVNTTYTTGVREAILNTGAFRLHEGLLAAYDSFVKENPYNPGKGWGGEPWFQKEMPLSEELLLDAAAFSDTAVVLIGRTAGEDQDNRPEPGSFLLTDDELQILRDSRRVFKKLIVLLNTGNVIDMGWMDTVCPDSVMYIWHGGQEGGNGVLKLLTGELSPSGKLADTIALDVKDYPAYENYGDPDRNFYKEDIYVGYRYFTTFAPDRVRFPFGFGLSYTDFSVTGLKTEAPVRFTPDAAFTVSACVTNTGAFSGKETVQVYAACPQGLLGKAARSLAGFAKTRTLAPGESETLRIRIPVSAFGSYDDAGLTGNKSCTVLEAGTYEFRVGTSSLKTEKAGGFILNGLVVLSRHEEALAPVIPFERLVPRRKPDGSFEKTYRMTPLKVTDTKARRLSRMPEELPYTGDLGYKLSDVVSGKVSLNAFTGQLSDHDLITLTRGEGMSSPKVTPGTGGCYGGVTDSLLGFGIPICCCTDGPSGIRMDSGATAFSLPNNTLIACSFNTALTEKLFEFLGTELRMNQIEALLGPGMNLHRYPLNGRNFEYFSEDPLLTGKMAAAQVRALHRKGVTGVLKHFFGNSQEYRRNYADNCMSERAARELYLKGFEIAVKETGAYEVMSTYGPVNGNWTLGNYDLLTTILRNDWGFRGIVMSDWWAHANDPYQEGEEAPSRQNTAAMIRAQNDLYMVNANAEENSNHDNLEEALAAGTVTRGELQRSAENILRVCMNTQAYDRMYNCLSEEDRALQAEKAEADAYNGDVTVLKLKDRVTLDPSAIPTGRGRLTTFQVVAEKACVIEVSFDCRMTGGNPLSQAALAISEDKKLRDTIALCGADTEWQHHSLKVIRLFQPNFFIKFFFNLDGMELKDITFAVRDDLQDELEAERKRRSEL